MSREIPKVEFSERERLGIEVMKFSELLTKLELTDDHDPYQIHKIEFYLILVVTRGTYTHFVDFESYTVTENSAIFIAKNQIHHFTEKLKSCQGYGVIFNRDFVNQHYFLSDKNKLNRLFNYHIEKPVISKDDVNEDEFSGIIVNLYDEYVLNNDFAKSDICGALLHVLLLKAERSKELRSADNVKKLWLETFTAFRRLLEKDYMRTRSSKVYASKLLVSYKFLNDVVKKLTDKTVKGFIDEYVTTEIKRYLVSTSLSVKEISYATGFEESANMVKFFKKHTNMTPLTFRQLK